MRLTNLVTTNTKLLYFRDWPKLATVCDVNLIPRVFSFSYMAAAGKKKRKTRRPWRRGWCGTFRTGSYSKRLGYQDWKVYRNLDDICICLKFRITKTIVFLHDVIVTSKTRRNVKGLGTWIVTKKHCACSWRSESVFCDPFFLLVVGIVSHPYIPILPCSIWVPWMQRLYCWHGF